jgi:hypothetical protein
LSYCGGRVARVKFAATASMGIVRCVITADFLRGPVHGY